MLIRLVPKLKTMLDNLRYTGKVHMLEVGDTPLRESSLPSHLTKDSFTPSHLTEDSYDLTFSNDVILFGGTAYHLHKINDNSPFSHILPGVHDVDVCVNMAVRGFPSDEEKHPEFPLNITSVNRLIEGMGNGSGHAVSALDQPDSILSFLLRNMVSTIREHILDETRAPGGIAREYDLFVDGKTNKVRLNPPFSPGRDEDGFLYSEVVANFFRIKVEFHGGMLKTQVEIKARDSREGISGMDHVFEVVMVVGEDNFNWKGKADTVNIRGIDVYSKQHLFHDNIESLVNRAASVTRVKVDADARLFAGKCAQDFLRILYILLDGLQQDEPRWVETKGMTRMFGVDTGKDIVDEMTKELGRLGTPIEVFLFLSGYVEPCIRASRIESLDVFKNEREIKRTRTIDREFRTIIDEFKRGFPHGQDLLKEKVRLERMMVARHEKLREKARAASARIASMIKGVEKQGEFAHYFNRDFDITMDVEEYAQDTIKARFLRQDGVLEVSGSSYSNGAVNPVVRHGWRTKYLYETVLEDGFAVAFDKDAFIRAFKKRYPDVQEPVFDATIWYKKWLKNRD